MSIKALPIKQNNLNGFSQIQEEQTSYAEEEEPTDGLSQQQELNAQRLIQQQQAYIQILEKQKQAMNEQIANQEKLFHEIGKNEEAAPKPEKKTTK